MKHRIISLLTLMLCAVSGAWAQADPNAVETNLKTYAKGDNQTYTATMALPTDKGLKITVEYEKIPDVVALPANTEGGQTYEVTLNGEATTALDFEPADMEGAQLAVSITPADGKKLTALKDGNADPEANEIAFDWNTETSKYEAPLTVSDHAIGITPTYDDLLTTNINFTSDWATFVPRDANYDAPATGFYTVSDISGSTVTATALSQSVVAKGTPLLVSAAEALTLTESRATKDIPSATIEGNMLQAGDGTTEIALSDNAYGLYNGEFILFEGVVPENKAYLVLSAPAAAPRLTIRFGDGETTSINEEFRMKNEESAPAYNLSGQRVSKSYKGLVIKNGKKVIIK